MSFYNKFSIVTKTSAYTLTDNDYIVNGDTTSAAITFTLPAAAGRIGLEYIIKNMGTKNLTIDGNASETIDDSLTKILTNKYASINIISNGTGWLIV